MTLWKTEAQPNRRGATRPIWKHEHRWIPGWWIDGRLVWFCNESACTAARVSPAERLRSEWPSIDDLAEPEDFPSVLGRVAGITPHSHPPGYDHTGDTERTGHVHPPEPAA